MPATASATWTRPPRSCTPSTTAPTSSISASAAKARPTRATRDRVRRKPQRPPGRSRRQRVRGGQPGRISGRRLAAGRLEGPGRRWPFGRRQHDGRQARDLLEHGLSDLTRRPRQPRLRRGRSRLSSRLVAPLPAPRLARRPLRLVERDLVRKPGGRRCSRARLGGESVPRGNPGRRNPQGDGVRKRKVVFGARLRRDRRRGRGCERPRTESHPARPGCVVAERPPPSPPLRSAAAKAPETCDSANVRLAVHLRTTAPIVTPDYQGGRRSRSVAAEAGIASRGRRPDAVEESTGHLGFAPDAISCASSIAAVRTYDRPSAWQHVRVRLS